MTRITRYLATGVVMVVTVRLVCAEPLAAPAPQPLESIGTGVLMISVDDPDQPYVRDLVEGFREGLDASPIPLVLYREFFDQIRFGDSPTYISEFRAWLHQKYRGRTLGAIVVTQQPILQLLAHAPDSPWNDVPIVYGALGNLTIDIRESHPTASGVVMENYFPRLLQVIKTLLPETRTIAAIQGASAAERARDGWWVPQIREAGFDVLNLSNLTIEQLLDRVAALPPGTVPLLLSFQRDAAGRTFRTGQTTARIRDATSQPLFRLAGLDAPGGVGGPNSDYRLAGGILAAHTLRRLQGESPGVETIPVARHSPLVFDARELERWGIPERRLPAGSIVQFRQPNLWRDYRGTVMVSVLIGAVLTTLLVVSFVERRALTRAQAALRSSYGQLQTLADRLITAQEEERSRIARDLHDDLGQRLVSLSIALSNLKRRVAGSGDDTLRRELAALQEQAALASTDLRHLSHDLHPGALEHMGLSDALRARCADFAAENGVSARLTASEDWNDPTDAIALCLYRVAQEALRNVAQHAHANNATVSLERLNGHVRMRVSDDGRGFDVATTTPRAGLGLMSLTERVRMLGGTMQVDATQPGGTTIDVSLPTTRGTDAT